MGWRFMVVLLAPAAFGFVMVPALSVASGQPRPTRPPVSVKPLSGGATTRFGVTFRAPDRAGRYGNLQRRYSIATTGGSPGCQASAATIRTSARKDELLHVTLAPPSTGWCAGTYRGRVQELASPVCGPARMVCPLYVVVLRRVGSFTFRVQ